MTGQLDLDSRIPWAIFNLGVVIKIIRLFFHLLVMWLKDQSVQLVDLGLGEAWSQLLPETCAHYR
jgi:hypothetical protein